MSSTMFKTSPYSVIFLTHFFDLIQHWREVYNYRVEMIRSNNYESWIMMNLDSRNHIVTFTNPNFIKNIKFQTQASVFSKKRSFWIFSEGCLCRTLLVWKDNLEISNKVFQHYFYKEHKDSVCLRFTPFWWRSFYVKLLRKFCTFSAAVSHM